MEYGGNQAPTHDCGVDPSSAKLKCGKVFVGGISGDPGINEVVVQAQLSET